jgi:glucose-6-phosphate 1-dehydrogenase
MTGRWTADALVIFGITGDLAQRMTFPVVGVANTDLTVAQLADLARKALEAKEPVIEVEYLRYANFAMAELWHRDSVAVIQITMAQQIGVADRGSFYDQVGALRDVVQNHLLQVLALVAMDPPVGPGADDLRDKKAEVLRAMPAAVSCPIRRPFPARSRPRGGEPDRAAYRPRPRDAAATVGTGRGRRLARGTAGHHVRPRAR